MIFSAIVVSLLLVLGISFGGVRMPLAEMAKLLGTLVAGSLPFSAMGLAIGYFVGPNSAPAAINLIYLPMSFCSGLWVPYMFLPKFMQQIALALPPYHLSQLALGTVGAGIAPVNRDALGSAVRLHPDLPGRSPHRLPARPGQALRLRRDVSGVCLQAYVE